MKIILQCYMFRLMNFEESNDVNQFGLYLFFFNLDRKMPIFGRFSCQDSIIAKILCLTLHLEFYFLILS